MSLWKYIKKPWNVMRKDSLTVAYRLVFTGRYVLK